MNSKKILGKNGASIVETLLVIILISVLIVIVMSKYEDIAWEAKKTALQTELVNVRQVILLFKITKGKYPASLKELITEKLMLPYKDTLIRAKYLELYSLDKDMNLLDPFDTPYAYDPQTGKVWSKKKGFETW
jgi:competence protein ComGC